MRTSPTSTEAARPGPAQRSRQLREMVVSMLAASRRGHLGSALSLLDILAVLFDDVLRYDPSDPAWPGRDRFVLSKGHGCLALYALLADKGFIPVAELDGVGRPGSRLGGHPEWGKVPGVEFSTGSLGHGLPVGVGFALNARVERSGARVFVLVGDGECNEGSVWEAALMAGKHRLSNLTVLVDYNKMQSFGPTAQVLDLEPLAAKWASFNFAVQEVDGHDHSALRRALGALPLDPDRPSAVICHTIKGKGVAFAEGNPAWHHKSRLSDDEIAALRAAVREQ